MSTREQVALPVRRITLREFERMVDVGVFPESERLELLRGEIIHQGEQTGRRAQRLARGLLPIRRIKVREFEKMLEAGIFGPDERLELLDGEIVRMTPQTDPHALSLMRTQDALEKAFGRRFFVRVQVPLEFVRQRSRPEPDLAVARGRPREWTRGIHASAALVVEVALTTLRRDRVVKMPIYASSGIDDYWIVSLIERVLEVHRGPVGSGKRARYESVVILGPRERIAPLAAPRRKVRVKDLLP